MANKTYLSLVERKSKMLKDMIKALATTCHEIAISKGWWDEPRKDGELVALIHSEASELLEALRHHNPMSLKIPTFLESEEELADIIIRCLDMAEARGYDLAGALLAKIEYNRTREHKHGGKAF